jgi:cation diffusion facilitator family transporter
MAIVKGASNKAVLAAMFANLGIAIAKFAGFLFTGASSMLAEAVHSMADTGNQALLLWGSRQAGRAPTELHPFGFGPERFFWSFVVSLILFTVGALFAVYEGIHKFLHPEQLSNASWAVGILLLGVMLETWSFATAIGEAKKLKGDLSWWSFIRNSRNPELPVVLLEDFAALVGLVLALLGIVLVMLTGEPRFDAMATVAIGILLGIVAVVLSVEMKSLLIGESATGEIVESLKRAALAPEKVKRVIHFRTMHLGPEELLVATKLEFIEGLDVPGLVRAIDEVEQAMRRAQPWAKMIFIEPDIYRPQVEDVTLR